MKLGNQFPLRRQAGAFAVWFALMAITLIGFVGLAVDSGRLFIAKGELQNAADACALAAAGELSVRTNERLIFAENAGRTVGQRNRVGMQTIAASIPVNSAVTFSEDLAGSYRTKDAITGAAVLGIRYVRCTIAETGIAPILIQVLNAIPGVSIGLGRADATAVAGLQPAMSVCPIPVAVCRKAPASPWGLTPGEWLVAVDAGGSATTGSFGFVSFFDGATKLATGPSAFNDMFKGQGQCQAGTANVVQSEPGVMATLQQGWNSRFGVWLGAPPNFQPTMPPPDRSGFSYNPTTWPSQQNAFSNFVDVQQPANTAAQPVGGGWRQANSGDLDVHGRERRLVIAPITNCDPDSAGIFATSKPKNPIDDWACVLMLNARRGPTEDYLLEYVGLAFDPSNPNFVSPCASAGLPGGGSGVGPRVPTLVQ